MNKVEWADTYSDAMVMEEHENALLGYDSREGRAIYDAEKIIDNLEKDMSREEALEYFSFNIECAWVGNMTPIYLWKFEDHRAPLTKKQRYILDYIIDYIEKNRMSPTLHDIAYRFKLSAESTVHKHVWSLEQKGYIKKEKNKSRSITVL